MLALSAHALPHATRSSREQTRLLADETDAHHGDIRDRAEPVDQVTVVVGFFQHHEDGLAQRARPSEFNACAIRPDRAAGGCARQHANENVCRIHPREVAPTYRQFLAGDIHLAETLKPVRRRNTEPVSLERLD